MDTWQKILFYMRDIGTYGTAIIAIATALTILIRPIRSRFIDWLKKITRSEEHNSMMEEFTSVIKKHEERDAEIMRMLKENREALQCTLRNDIVSIYYKYLPEKKIPSYQMENLAALYSRYKVLTDNTFVKKIYKEMENWEVINRK